jgi:hypothetical protein
MDNQQTVALEELKEKVTLRDKMGAALYWNVLNEECCRLANKCRDLGCDENEIGLILGQGTYVIG